MDEKMRKRNMWLSFVLAGALCLAPVQTGNAKEISVVGGGGTVSPCYLYTRSIITDLSISGKSATMTGVARGIAGTATKIHVKLVLQKYTDDGWSKVEAYEKTENSAYCSLEKTKSVSSGKYRVKGVYTVYKGEKSEKTTQYSNTVSC